MNVVEGMARLLFGFLGIAAVFAVWYLFFAGIMGVTVYIMKLFPLTGQWRKRLRARWKL